MIISRESSIGLKFFESLNFGENFQNFEKSLNFENYDDGRAAAQRVMRAGISLTVHRSFPCMCPVAGSSWDHLGPPGNRLGPF